MRVARALSLLAVLGTTACTEPVFKADTGDTGNGAPALTVDVPAPGSAFDAGDSVRVAGFVVDDRDASDDVVIRVAGDVSGDLGAARPAVDGNWERTVAVGAGDTTLIVTATDREGAETQVDVALTVYDPSVNNAPSTPVFHLEPAAPRTGDPVRVVIDAESVDPDGFPVSYDISWTIDGAPFASGEGIGPDTLFRGQAVHVEVRGNDGVVSSEVAVADLVVANAAPEGAFVSVFPDGDPTVESDLVCVVSGLFDREDDALLLNYSWTVAGTPAGSDMILPAGAAHAGEDIVCTVLADDGFAVSEFSSIVFQIGNAAPTPPVVSVFPAAPTDTDDLLCEVTVDSWDPDGDPVLYDYAWYRDGDYAGFLEPTLPSSVTTRDQMWTCEVTATDIGGLSSAVGRATTRILPAWSGTQSASEAWATIDGRTASGSFGKSISIVGDVDGDLVDDLLVGAPGERSGAGMMYLFSGADLGGASTVSDAAASWFGTRGGWSLGGYRAVSAPGDLDGDGYADLLFAATEADANGTNSGEVYLVYGSPALGTNNDVAGRSDWSFYGSSNDLVGARLATGDIDGDGIVDMMVSAPGASGTARNAGAVMFLRGEGGRLSGHVDAAAVDRFVYGDGELDELGWTLRYVGDVNDDGYGDVFTTAMYADVNGSESGTGSLLTGGPVITGTSTASSVAEAQFFGATAGDRLGYDASGEMDLDGDSRPDLILGVYQDDTFGTDAGSILLYRGRSRWASSYQMTDADLAIGGELAGGRFGHVFGNPGDLDGDRTADLVIGALFANPDGLASQGATYVLSGPDVSMVPTAGALWRSAGEATGDLYGDAVGFGAGDLDGDGRNDFAVGAHTRDTTATDAGRVYVWRGR